MTVIVSDGTGARTGMAVPLIVTIPEIQLNSFRLTYVEIDAPQQIAPAAEIPDPEPLGVAGGSLTVSFASGPGFASGVAPEDRLRIRNAGTGSGQIGLDGDTVTWEGIAVGTLTGGQYDVPLRVAFNQDVTQAAVAELVRSITFRTLSDNPSTKLRHLAFVLQHTNGTISDPAYTTVKVQSVNDPPELSLGSLEATYAENAAPVQVSPAAVVTDPDSSNMGGGRLTVSIESGGATGDRLFVRNVGQNARQIGVCGSTVTWGGVPMGTISGGQLLNPLRIDLLSTASRWNVQKLIQNITFQTLGDNPSGKTRQVSFVLNDGDVSIPARKCARIPEPVEPNWNLVIPVWLMGLVRSALSHISPRQWLITLAGHQRTIAGDNGLHERSPVGSVWTPCASASPSASPRGRSPRVAFHFSH